MNKYYVYLILSGILCGLIVFGGAVLSNLGLSAYEISVFSLIPSILVLAPIVVFNRSLRIRLNQTPFFLFFGLIGAIGILCQYAAVAIGVPVAIVVLLLYTQPVWTMLFSRLFLKEEITKIKLIATLIVVIGVLILVNPFGVSMARNWIGILISLIGGVMLSAWFVMGSVSSKKGTSILSTKLYESLFVLFFLLVSLSLFGNLISDQKIVAFSLGHRPIIWITVILLGLIGILIPNLLYFEGVKKVSTIDSGIIMLLEPVSAAILAAIFLKQHLTLNLVIGGALILLANYLVISKGSPAAPVKKAKLKTSKKRS